MRTMRAMLRSQRSSIDEDTKFMASSALGRCFGRCGQHNISTVWEGVAHTERRQSACTYAKQTWLYWLRGSTQYCICDVLWCLVQPRSFAGVCVPKRTERDDGLIRRQSLVVGGNRRSWCLGSVVLYLTLLDQELSRSQWLCLGTALWLSGCPTPAATAEMLGEHKSLAGLLEALKHSTGAKHRWAAVVTRQIRILLVVLLENNKGRGAGNCSLGAGN
ncbi:uncharacterized protein B0I36DRAFT_111458 [Microdochium trichocladiopsis]|uniref:Uncharacterized protein n=1 Tax=Microdochium trichocladiopsis TaxID=1682393 RepID=A0A9P8Y9Z0_9PEZI|nr:uncharacterized protein B0I36DRAFT_111458 [Microdochium trichocladiopsis]KAH7033693.1 hypothetical protein B0I36DRAFT_111458 [Microdochium trichocladiopsis]